MKTKSDQFVDLNGFSSTKFRKFWENSKNAKILEEERQNRTEHCFFSTFWEDFSIYTKQRAETWFYVKIKQNQRYKNDINVMFNLNCIIAM